MLLVLSMELFCLNQIIFWDSKDLVPDDGSAKLVDTNFWAVWVEQSVPYTQFLPRKE